MTKKLEAKINKLLHGQGEKMCFTCYNVNANWLVELQDIIEEENISVETFCATPTDYCGKPFKVKNNRLRLSYARQCISISTIKSVFEKLYK